MGLLSAWMAGIIFVVLALGVSFSVNYVLAFFTDNFGSPLGMIFTVILYATAVPIVIGELLMRDSD